MSVARRLTGDDHEFLALRHARILAEPLSTDYTDLFCSLCNLWMDFMLASTRPYDSPRARYPSCRFRVPVCIGAADEPGRSESREPDDRHAQRQSTQYRSTSAA